MTGQTDPAHALIAAVAAWHGVVVPPSCVAGVAASLEILRTHMDIVRTAAGHAPADPAELLAP